MLVNFSPDIQIGKGLTRNSSEWQHIFMLAARSSDIKNELRHDSCHPKMSGTTNPETQAIILPCSRYRAELF